MDYILSGDPVTVGKVIQENRIRIQRGEIKFSPVGEDDTVTVGKDVEEEDSKYIDGNPDSKTPKAAVKRNRK